MGIGDKLRESIGSKAREISDKAAQSYRDHVGETLAKKQEELQAFELDLNAREKEITDREANLKKFYLIPRAYVNVPVALAFIAAVYFAYTAVSPWFDGMSRGTATPAETATPSDQSSSSESGVPPYSICIRNGIAYYKEIGSYPRLSTGEDAATKVEGMCRGSGGMAFRR